MFVVVIPPRIFTNAAAIFVAFCVFICSSLTDHVRNLFLTAADDGVIKVCFRFGKKLRVLHILLDLPTKRYSAFYYFHLGGYCSEVLNFMTS